MASINDVLRRTALIDTSGTYPAPAIQLSARMAGGIYPQDPQGDAATGDTVLAGRISLTLMALLILAAVGFYVWTRGIQGGG